jgi:peptidoglycan/xylan/chitin deacetylase (PgdA/CDA1 family)
VPERLPNAVEVALKIDVDTHQGLGQGVPRLARMLAAEGVAATFFIAMGPDHSGRAILRVLRNPGFVRKMLRTRAVTMYGLRTVLSGTLLPARPIALAYPEIVRELIRMGFEVGVHGYDHVLWQDHLDEIGETGVRNQIADGFEVYRAITGAAAQSFAAPGWRTSEAALRVLDTMGLSYRSDTRGERPYRCASSGELFATPEIPTTLPTMDEVMGAPDLADGAAVVRFYLERFIAGRLNVHTVHAETEGMGQADTFAALVRELKLCGARFVRLREVAANLTATELPVCEVIRTTLPGRAGWISAQGRGQAAFTAATGL